MGPGFGSGFDTGFDFFDLFPIFFGIIFVLVIGVFIVTAVKGIGQWSKNEQSPELSVPAIVKAKRTQVRGSRHHHHSDHHHHHSTTRTTYYATFEFDSGDRKEFQLSDQDYGMIAEDDIGILTFKGTRFLGFERRKDSTLNQSNQ
nr:DUF2500 domain-containing protein [Ornithinibacillus californiensis]